jgi:hypothetical protein
MIALFQTIHGLVPLIQELVPEVLVIDQIPLPTTVVESLIIVDTGEIAPFRVGELIS